VNRRFYRGPKQIHGPNKSLELAVDQNLADTLNDEIRGIDLDLGASGTKWCTLLLSMLEVDLYISAYSCLMADQTRMSQYVEVVLAWLWKQSDP
jgi:hypothetical protein